MSSEHDRIRDAIAVIVSRKRGDGSVLPFALSIEVAREVRMGVRHVERLARDYQPSVSKDAMVKRNGSLRTDALANLPTMIGEHHSQTGGEISRLSPLFTEEMMGFPLMWTTLPFLTPHGDRNQSRPTATR